MKNIWNVRPLFYAFLISLFLYSSTCAGQPYNCHAFTLEKLTGKSLRDGKDRSELSDWLKDTNNGYSRYSFKAGSDWKALDAELRDGDVIIIPPAHSGIVIGGRIHHFTKASKTYKIAAKENVDALHSLMNKEVIVKGEAGQTWKRYPYKKRPVEVWRKTSSVAGLKKGICRGPADGLPGAWIQDSNGCYNIPRKPKKRTKFEDSRVIINGEEPMFDNNNPYGTTPGFKW